MQKFHSQIFQKSIPILGQIIFPFYLFLFLNHRANAQYINAQIPPYDITSGLPDNEVLDIVKDPSGFFWIATGKGLSRFDGYHFENFNSTSHPNIFHDNRINRIKKNGDLLYLLTERDGLIELNPKKLTFKKLSNDKPLSIAFSNDTTAFLFDTGLLLVKQQNRILLKEKTIVGSKSSVLIYQGDLLLSADNSDIYRINLSSPSERVKLPIENNRAAGELLLSKTYGVINWNKWRVLILKNNQFVEHPEFIDKIDVSFFAEEPSGTILSIDRNRIPNVVCNGQNYSIVFAKEENIQYRCICRINETSLFIGSNQGLIPLTFHPTLSARILDYPLMRFNEPMVRRKIIEHNNNRYFLGFPYILEQNEQGETKLLTDSTFSSYDGLIFNEELYLTAEGRRTLLSIDLHTKKITTHISSSLLPVPQMLDISVFSDSLLLVAGENKIKSYNPKNKRSQEFNLDAGISIYTAAQIGKSNFILLGTNKGIYRIQLTPKRGFEYVDQPCSGILEVKDILIRENENDFWLATNTGVVVAQLSDFKISHVYSNAFEVSNPKVTALMEDQNGCIWATTYFGITVYNTQNGTIRFLGKSHGLINQEFNYSSSCLLKNGSFIFGGLNGFEIIDPIKLNDFHYSKTFQISGIEHIQIDKTKQFSNYQDGQTISFRTGVESIVIHLSHLDYQYKKGYSFRYCIDGNNWFDADEKGSIVLTDLTYGEYTLKIQMFDPFRNLVEEKSFPIIATAPFYMKAGYQIFFVLCFLAIVILFGLNILRSQNIRAITKAKIAMDLHDESGTILTRLLLVSKKEKFELREKEIIQSGLKEALFSFRTYLDSISTKSHSLQDLSDDLKEFIASACADGGIQFKFKMNFEKKHSINRELYRDVKLSVYEILSNCLKHSKASSIEIVCKSENKLLTLILSDNGTCDLSALATQRGNGIRNITNRAKRNNGYVRHYIKEGETGLTTEIRLPIV